MTSNNNRRIPNLACSVEIRMRASIIPLCPKYTGCLAKSNSVITKV